MPRGRREGKAPEQTGPGQPRKRGNSLPCDLAHIILKWIDFLCTESTLDRAWDLRVTRLPTSGGLQPHVASRSPPDQPHATPRTQHTHFLCTVSTLSRAWDLRATRFPTTGAATARGITQPTNHPQRNTTHVKHFYIYVSVLRWEASLSCLLCPRLGVPAAKYDACTLEGRRSQLPRISEAQGKFRSPGAPCRMLSKCSTLRNRGRIIRNSDHLCGETSIAPGPSSSRWPRMLWRITSFAEHKSPTIRK